MIAWARLFLRGMLVKMGFGDSWIRWMDVGIFNNNMSILVNGSPTTEFLASRGLIQGDPLSPYLFTIVAEAFAEMVRKSNSIGGFLRLKMGEEVSYDLLQFADDTILLGEGPWRNLWAIKFTLRGFEMIPGLKVNMRKSNLYGVDLDDSFLQVASQFLLCKFGRFPFKFLGIMVGGNHRRCQFWNPILVAKKAKLSSWIDRMFSIGESYAD